MDVAVALVESYLRLNGYLTATEWQVQRETKGRFQAATDLDVLAIRLPWAAETVARPGAESSADVTQLEDGALDVNRDGPDVLIVEVKEGAARLNRVLREHDVLYAALRRIGCCPESHIHSTAEALTRRGEVRLDPPQGISCRVRLASFAGYADEPLPSGVLVLTLAHIVSFVGQRFTENREILHGIHFADPVLGTLSLLDKLGFGLERRKSSERQ